MFCKKTKAEGLFKPRSKASYREILAGNFGGKKLAPLEYKNNLSQDFARKKSKAEGLFKLKPKASILQRIFDKRFCYKKS